MLIEVLWILKKKNIVVGCGGFLGNLREYWSPLPKYLSEDIKGGLKGKKNGFENEKVIDSIYFAFLFLVFVSLSLMLRDGCDIMHVEIVG